MAEDKSRPDQRQGEIVIYQAEDGLTKVECRFVDETVWLTQQQMAELFHTSRSNIVEHIGHIYEEGELDEVSTCRKFRQVRALTKYRKNEALIRNDGVYVISGIFCRANACVCGKNAFPPRSLAANL